MIHLLPLRLKEKSNRGFTLVELIVVVAIIAILSVASIPAMIRYIEKSNIGVDEAYIEEVVTALTVIAATTDIKTSACPVTVTFDTTGKIQECTATGSDASATEDAVDAYLLEIYPASEQTFESRYYTGTAEECSPGVTLVLDTRGVVSISGTKNINS